MPFNEGILAYPSGAIRSLADDPAKGDVRI
jgi:hypothetical protein